MTDTTSATKQYRAVQLEYTAESWTERQSIDLSPVRELQADGWDVHTFSFDEDGRWTEAMMVKRDE